MPTIRQLIQTNPVRANDLFARLADTSDNAIKTRERLMADLKEELELLTELEEKHLFPVLRKHKQTKDLVAEAINDNREMRKLLAELDRTPRDSTEFGGKLAELRAVFQQHVRDEKKELLPAVLKALSDEEAQAVVERIEDHKAGIEEEKRAEAEERRAAARQEREQAEQMQQATEAAVRTLWSGPQAAERTAQTAQEAARTGLSTATEVAQRTSDQVLEVLNQTGERAQELARLSSQNLTLMTEASSILARGIQDLSREWLGLIQEQLQKNVDGFNALASCRSVPEFLALQNQLIRDRLQQSVEGARRIAAASTRVADEATRTISAKTANDTQRRAA